MHVGGVDTDTAGVGMYVDGALLGADDICVGDSVGNGALVDG